jgi:hypothetical protein
MIHYEDDKETDSLRILLLRPDDLSCTKNLQLDAFTIDAPTP